MTDAIIRLDTEQHDPGELVLDGEPLAAVLEEDSWEALREALTEPAELTVELYTQDGRLLEAEVDDDGTGRLITLHDVSHHARDAEQLAGMAVRLARQNHDLRSLYDAVATFAAERGVHELLVATARTLAEYLHADAVRVEACGELVGWPPGCVPEGGRCESRPLTTPRGSVGTVTWWRETPLASNEDTTVTVLLGHAAVSLDHALLLLDPAEETAVDTATGLLTASAARRRLAGFARPFALALLEVPPDGGASAPSAAQAHLEVVADVLRTGRDRDVKARWGRRRLLVGLERADLPTMRRWLDERARELADPGGPAPWAAALAAVEEDLDAALEHAGHALDGELAAGASRRR